MPCVLFITADQWRADCLGAHGHPCLRTPHLDALAARGVSFRQHFAQASPCGPSRASLHTGTYLMTHRSVSNGTPLDPRLTNVALEVRKAGMEAALIGYTDTSADPRGLEPGDRRLHTYTGVMPGYRQRVPDSEGPIAWTRHLRALGLDADVPQHPEDEPDIWQPVADYPGATERGPTYAPARYPPELSDTAFCVDHAIDYLQGRAGQDWFLHLSLLRPHPPFVAPAPYHDLYSPEQGPPLLRQVSAEREAGSHPYLAHVLAQTREWLREHGLDMTSERHRRQLRATYWGMMTEVDHHLGRLLEALRASGDLQRTLVVFTSDHGEQLWDHWALGKRSFHDQSFHIPLLIAAPGLPADLCGRQLQAFTESVDIMPTILDFLGLPAPAQCDGESLLPWLRGEVPARWRDAVHYELDFRDVAEPATEQALGLDLESCNFAVLRDRDHKYVHFAGLPALLYDLRSDPGECNNLATSAGHAATLAHYAQRLLSHRMRHAERSLTGLFLSRERGLLRADERRRRLQP